MLPDNMTIEVRTYCIQFISHATIDELKRSSNDNICFKNQG